MKQKTRLTMDKMKQTTSQSYEMTSIICVSVFSFLRKKIGKAIEENIGKRLDQTIHQRSYPNRPKTQPHQLSAIQIKAIMRFHYIYQIAII